MSATSAAGRLARLGGRDNFIPYMISPFGRPTLKVAGSPAPHAAASPPPRFAGKYSVFTRSGREALEIALRRLALRPEQSVWIETTSNNRYISACVTRAVERICRWTRTWESATAAILFNHEFGFPGEGLERYRSFGLPIIEDCAFSYLSDNSEGTMGSIADYVIVSFPKFLPVPSGGALYAVEPLDGEGADLAEVAGLVSHYLPAATDIAARRRANYAGLQARFGTHGMAVRFEMKPWHTPGVFMFKVDESVDLQKLREWLNARGIQSSAFFGESAYFIPCHHELDEEDLDYLTQSVVYGLECSA